MIKLYRIQIEVILICENSFLFLRGCLTANSLINMNKINLMCLTCGNLFFFFF